MNKTSLKLFALLIVACGLLLSSNAFGYVYINSSQCPNGARWSSANQPLDYWINQNGSADVPMSQLQTVIENSWSEWSEPCCSSFSANYRGTTSDTALSRSGNVVLSWEERSWPTQMGNVNQTIAVTLSSVYRSCEIASAPILFNGVGFQFCTTGSRCTDLQAIATHEIGHNLGLGHSQYSDATMYAAYTGGTGARSLSQDDTAGVCSLYPGSCNCSSDSDCGPNQVCNGNTCEEAPCASNSDCPSGKECNTSTGDCQIPTCGSDADCDDGYICDNNGQCVSSCPVCRSCTSQADCGANGFCADLGGGSKCITNCGEGGACPGDSQCFQVPAPATSGSCSSSTDCSSGDQCYNTQSGGVCATPCSSDGDCGSNQACQSYGNGVNICADVHNLCLNPDAGNGAVCPSNYTCQGGDGTGGGGGSTGACGGLGNSCDPGTQDFSQCTADNDVCLTMSGGNSICSCMCSDDADCGQGGLCVNVSNGQKACVPGSSTGDPCAGVTCGSGEVCQNGQCVDDGSSPGGDTGGGGGADAGGFDDTGSGGGGGGSGGDGGIVIERPSSNSGSEESTCSTIAPGSGAPGSLMLLAAFGLGALWRRRQRDA